MNQLKADLDDLPMECRAGPPPKAGRLFAPGSLLLPLLCFAVVAPRSVQGAGLDWPTDRFLPAFSAPAAIIDCIDISSASGAQIDLYTSLEGIVNRDQPRIVCVSSSSEEGKFTWLNIHSLPFAVISGDSAILKYRTNVTGLVVTDINLPDTLDLATTIAGLKNELICDPSLAGTYTNAPYNLPIKDDLRGMFSDKFQAYHYLYTNYWPQCTHRIFTGLQTNLHGHLRDYLVATKGASVWLNPAVAAEASALAPFLADMTPVGGVYMGWWPDEAAGLSWIAAYGIPVIASDFFENASLYGGVISPVTIPPIPQAPTLQNKVYVSITLSDGDNVQYMQHHMKQNWGNAARGNVPIGWTAQPLAADLDPAMLNYYWSTATTNDCLLSGPSGAGYTRINYWSPLNALAFARASSPYLQRSGMRAITAWLTVSTATAYDYAAYCPSLLGVNDHAGGYYLTHHGTLPVIGFPANANYSSTAAQLITGISNAAAGWTGSAPMFIPVQGSGWDITPADCQTIANSLYTNEFVVVRPDHLFMLYRQAVGMISTGAPQIYENLPTTLNLPASFPLNLTIYSVGSQPFGYRWLLNGAVVTNDARVAGAQEQTLSVSPAFLSDAGRYLAIVSNAFGAVTSGVCSVTIGRNTFYSSAGWTRNGHAGPLTNNSMTLTDGAGSENSSVFLNYPQYIGKFVCSFTYQDVGGGGADGCAFVLQNSPSGSAALGPPGGGLGCAGLSPSIALEFNIYSPYGVGMALRTNGLTGAPYNSTSPVNLAGGNPIDVSLSYNGTTLTISMLDRVSLAKYTTSAAIDTAGILGGNTAYVGMTGADGGVASTQVVSNFLFVSLTSLSVVYTETKAVGFNWPNSAGGLVLQHTPSLTTPWVLATDAVTLDGNGNNQITIPAQNSTRFYRLATP